MELGKDEMQEVKETEQQETNQEDGAEKDSTSGASPKNEDETTRGERPQDDKETAAGISITGFGRCPLCSWMGFLSAETMRWRLRNR